MRILGKWGENEAIHRFVVMQGAVLGLASAQAARRVTALPEGHPLAGAIRLGPASGGPSVREVVEPEIAATVFTASHDGEPVSGWFGRTFRAALAKNGMLAKDADKARYELSATVEAMHIVPLATGASHISRSPTV